MAREWVVQEGSAIPNFYGAYFAGSVNWLSDDAILPATSDLDLTVVISDPSAPTARRKLLYRDVLLEITHLSLEQLSSPEAVLGDYHLAGGFRTPSVILDPSGRLARLQRAVSCDYAKREWVRRRCEHARREVLDGLAAVHHEAPLPGQVMGWLFATGKTTHILLTAGLKNPTVRRRYAAVRDLLAEYGYLAFHETLLELLGSREMSRARVEQHLAALIEVFDAAGELIRTPFPFATDISAIARPLAIDGSRELIEQGLHREALFWIAVAYSRCQMVLAVDGPAKLQRRGDPGYERLLGDLDIASSADLKARSRQIEAHLGRVWNVAEAIMAANTV